MVLADLKPLSHLVYPRRELTMSFLSDSSRRRNLTVSKLTAWLILGAFLSSSALAESAPDIRAGKRRGWLGFGVLGVGSGTGAGLHRSVVGGLRWRDSERYAVLELNTISTEWGGSDFLSSDEHPLHSFDMSALLIGVIQKFGRHGFLVDVGIAQARTQSTGYTSRDYDYRSDQYVYTNHPGEESRQAPGVGGKLGYQYAWSHVGVGCGATGILWGNDIDGLVYVNLALGFL